MSLMAGKKTMMIFDISHDDGWRLVSVDERKHAGTIGMQQLTTAFVGRYWLDVSFAV